MDPDGRTSCGCRGPSPRGFSPSFRRRTPLAGPLPGAPGKRPFPCAVHTKWGGTWPVTVTPALLGPATRTLSAWCGGHTGHSDHKSQTSSRGPGPLAASEESLVSGQLCPSSCSDQLRPVGWGVRGWWTQRDSAWALEALPPGGRTRYGNEARVPYLLGVRTCSRGREMNKGSGGGLGVISSGRVPRRNQPVNSLPASGMAPGPKGAAKKCLKVLFLISFPTLAIHTGGVHQRSLL